MMLKITIALDVNSIRIKTHSKEVKRLSFTVFTGK